MRSALCRLSYRAATRRPDQSELAHKRPLAPRRIALAFRISGDRKNLRHNVFTPSHCRLQFPISIRVTSRTQLGNRQLAIANVLGGPRGSRTHYPSIKSRELILMSFRPADCGIRTSECGFDEQGHSAIQDPQFLRCARRDSNPAPGFKKPVLRHQSFERMALAAGFEPALTSLEERRLIPLGHASFLTTTGKEQRDRRDSNSRKLDRQSSASASRPRPR